jgi:catechol 2,3-dioxygenase-like lactoylglutathione lyase family enzyme
VTPPLGDIAHVGHAQLFTPDLDASVAFFTDYLGLTVCAQDGGTVFLRTYDDYEHHSLVLTARDEPGLGRLALRTFGEEALRRRVAAREAAGRHGTWVEDEPGLGTLYVTTDPGGHEHALYWESEHYRAPDELKPALKNQPQAKPGRGVGVRRLDHINFLAADVLANAEFQEQLLGARPTEQIRLDPAGSPPVGSPTPTSPTTSSTPRTGPAPPAGCTTSPSRPTPARTSCAPPTSPSTPACSPRRARTSTPSSRRSSSTSTSRAATASNCATRSPAWCWPPTGR